MISDRLQKPFLTVETGEAYQPIRLSYKLNQPALLSETLNKLQCLERKQANNWNWFWKEECAHLNFESIESYKKNPQNPCRLGSFSLQQDYLYLSLPSFKRACLAVPFFFSIITQDIGLIHYADFINKVFGLDERLPHGFAELFKEEELVKIIQQREKDFQQIQTSIESAATPEQAFSLLANYSKLENQKKLPFAERYAFDTQLKMEPEVIFLSFYIFLRGRELVAIRRWFGDSNYTLLNAAEETVERAFGNMDIDLLE